MVNDDIQPNSRYELDNGTTFTTNADGYVEEITFKPDFNNKGKRDKRQTAVGKEGVEGDVGGHIQACAMGGTCDRYNLFPQNSNFNNSAYKTYFENVLKKANRKGQSVDNVNIKFTRKTPGSPRPDELKVTFTIDGREFTRDFQNQHGGGLN